MFLTLSLLLLWNGIALKDQDKTNRQQNEQQKTEKAKQIKITQNK